ncbi:unnamed protein product [Closterium sp. Yama58-4]|nr:unnamed protein product [Closterium sp. Yama58-4]
MTVECTKFFQSLYSGATPDVPNPAFWAHIPPSSLPPRLLNHLQAPFSLLKISKALSQLTRGKTPGPDGIPGELFRQYNTRFAPAFFSLFSSPHISATLPPSMLSGRTVLIPKRGSSSMVDNLRPITLMNSDYKVLALCLANRLQLALPQIIHPSQTAFIKSRKIGDTINDTLDIFDWSTTTKTPLLALTVDFRKAYDLVDRAFLFRALAMVGLPEQFIAWVRLMHTNTSTCISVNNLAGPNFPVRTGVRQGCPLAPLLFVCVIEILQRYLSLFLPGFPLSTTQRRLMACYADDVTIFLSSVRELGTTLIHLRTFAAVSGEHPNWNKCSIIPFHIAPEQILLAGPIPIRTPQEAERILGIYVERAQPSDTTWSTTLSRIQRMAKFLAALRATATCRKSLTSVFLNSIISFPGRFQPPSPDIIKRLDVLVGNFISSSRFKEHGLAVRLIPNRLLYNSTRHGGLGAIAPSTQIRALAAHRALRRLGVSPSEEVARAAVCLPFGTHCLLAHPAILQSGILPTVILSRALAELRALIEITPVVAPPRLTPLCIMGEPTAFNRFILKPNGKLFGILMRERFLLSMQVRIGHLISLIFHSLALRSPPPPSAALGEWFVPKEDSETSPTLALQVTAFSPPSSLSVSLYRVHPNRFIVRPAFGDGTFHIGALSAVHVVGSWLAGPFHTGSGLGARLDILQDGCPSVADIRRRLYTQLPLDHAARWIHVLSAPPPLLPDLSHDFLREQPSLQRDVLFRFYTRAFPSDSRFNFAADRGICSLCLAAPTETISHIFYECGFLSAPSDNQLDVNDNVNVDEAPVDAFGNLEDLIVEEGSSSADAAAVAADGADWILNLDLTDGTTLIAEANLVDELTAVELTAGDLTAFELTAGDLTAVELTAGETATELAANDVSQIAVKPDFVKETRVILESKLSDACLGDALGDALSDAGDFLLDAFHATGGDVDFSSLGVAGDEFPELLVEPALGNHVASDSEVTPQQCHVAIPPPPPALQPMRISLLQLPPGLVLRRSNEELDVDSGSEEGGLWEALEKQLKPATSDETPCQCLACQCKSEEDRMFLLTGKRTVKADAGAAGSKKRTGLKRRGRSMAKVNVGDSMADVNDILGELAQIPLLLDLTDLPELLGGDLGACDTFWEGADMAVVGGGGGDGGDGCGLEEAEGKHSSGFGKRLSQMDVTEVVDQCRVWLHEALQSPGCDSIDVDFCLKVVGEVKGETVEGATPMELVVEDGVPLECSIE